jgi:hypothetical protein
MPLTASSSPAAQASTFDAETRFKRRLRPSALLGLTLTAAALGAVFLLGGLGSLLVESRWRRREPGEPSGKEAR